MKLNPKVFKLAAELVIEPGNSTGACRAISNALYELTGRSPHEGYETGYHNFFDQCFSPKKGVHAYYFGETDPNDQFVRSIALLLCVQLVKDVK